MHGLDFEMKVSFYGAITEGDIVREVVSDVFFMNAGVGGDSDIKVETITTTPKPLSTIGMPDSDFGFDNTIVLTQDSAT